MTGEDKQTLILQATLDLIAERGFHDAPVSAVAKRSGVSTGIIYHYFDSKDALIHELYRRIEGDFIAALMVGDPQDMPWPDHLRQVWLNAYRFYVTHPQEAAFLEQYKNSPYHRLDLEALAQNPHMRKLFEVITADVAQGWVRDMPFMLLYELTLGVAVRLARHQTAGTLDLDDDTLATVAAAICRAIEP